MKSVNSIWRWDLAIVAIVLIVSAVALLAAIPSVGSLRRSPQIIVSPAKFHCDAKEGEEVGAVFTVTNHTRVPVRLLGATTSCSCAAPRGLPAVLEPGCSQQVTLSVTVGPPDSDGIFSQSADIFTNYDVAAPSLNFEAHVIRPTLLKKGT